jgi:hypothetical protein
MRRVVKGTDTLLTHEERTRKEYVKKCKDAAGKGPCPEDCKVTKSGCCVPKSENEQKAPKDPLAWLKEGRKSITFKTRVSGCGYRDTSLNLTFPVTEETLLGKAVIKDMDEKDDHSGALRVDSHTGKIHLCLGPYNGGGSDYLLPELVTECYSDKLEIFVKRRWAQTTSEREAASKEKKDTLTYVDHYGLPSASVQLSVPEFLSLQSYGWQKLSGIPNPPDWVKSSEAEVVGSAAPAEYSAEVEYLVKNIDDNYTEGTFSESKDYLVRNVEAMSKDPQTNAFLIAAVAELKKQDKQELRAFWEKNGLESENDEEADLKRMILVFGGPEKNEDLLSRSQQSVAAEAARAEHGMRNYRGSQRTKHYASSSSGSDY